ncbi:MAG: phosphoribosylglycinamide formyltransferase [Thermoanaerobaculia bacterium]|nr:phosphoribosylglycinamide formyltransferase [Thermoanaerobaculia bacterium]
MTAVRVGVLLSGRGSNFSALVAGFERLRTPAQVVLVVSDEATAGGLERATEMGIDSRVVSPKDYPTRAAHEAAMIAVLKDAGVEWVCLAGFMRILGPDFVRAFPSRILNIHPSLLPSFPGLHAQRQAVAYGVLWSGCTVHLVDEGLDSGPIVGQRVVRVLEDDTEESLSSRILEEEHKLYSESLHRLLLVGWRIEGRRVLFDE